MVKPARRSRQRPASTIRSEGSLINNQRGQFLKIKLLVSYDGSSFCGYQRQAHLPIPSIQEVLEKGLSQFFQQKIVLYASGRTDAGVHALAQICHFEVEGQEERLRTRDLCWAMKGILPPAISVRKAWIAPPEFHATLSATHKTYRYFIYCHPRSNPFLRHTSAWKRHRLNIDHLQASSKFLLGKHDFKSFQSAGTPVRSTVRRIHRADWEWTTPNMLRFTITGQGFLKQMVRNIVGTELLLEKEGRRPEEMKEILESLDRTRAGAPAPAEGLFLWKVYYPRELDNQCRPL